MESLIPVIGKLQDVFAAVGSRENEVDLPQIVVVGSQSAGKSSVIEGIVGRDFLPRGSGIVTRRPLLIQLIYTPEGDDRRKIDGELLDGDFATFEHQQGKTYTNFEEVRKEIEAETNRGTSGKKGVSRKQISLKIYSANVVNLSLVDLPGITKVPVDDQPANIEGLILEMIKPFIINENSIILAVTPANYDFANSEALKLAREVDANGDRTLCVLTKLDLMDKGTNAMDVLQGKSIPVKLGIIGVVSRSQEDIVANKSIGACLNDEKAFLQNNYRGLASTNGIPYLAKRLSNLLHHHIQKTLPNLKDQILKLITKFHGELSTMGEPIVDQRKTFFQVINNISSAYIATLNGCATSIESSELNGGAKICDIFYNELEKDIGGLTPMGNLSVKSVLSCIKNGSGLKPAMFIPEQSFDALIKMQMERFKEPMLNCVDRVSEELIRMIQNCGDKVRQEMQRFPLLFDHIHKIVSTMIITKTEETA
uniref:Dynamin-type G domain-containing protein n=1 Tax=Panagrolaimus sp. PS1159 TaxID=55785 RepID=A0AC35EU33_9BILA